LCADADRRNEPRNPVQQISVNTLVDRGNSDLLHSAAHPLRRRLLPPASLAL
jgi:hypothetical protein